MSSRPGTATSMVMTKKPGQPTASMMWPLRVPTTRPSTVAAEAISANWVAE